MAFEILGPNGDRLQLKGVEYFLDEYEPKGYIVPDDQPSWLDKPDVKAAKAKRKEKQKAAEEREAERESARKAKEAADEADAKKTKDK